MGRKKRKIQANVGKLHTDRRPETGAHREKEQEGRQTQTKARRREKEEEPRENKRRKQTTERCQKRR